MKPRVSMLIAATVLVVFCFCIAGFANDVELIESGYKVRFVGNEDQKEDPMPPSGGGGEVPANILFDNFGEGHQYDTHTGWTLSGNALEDEYVAASAFVADRDAKLTAIEVAVGLIEGLNAVEIFVCEDFNGLPGITLEVFRLFNQMGRFGNFNPPVVGQSELNPVLKSGRQYWVLVSLPGSKAQGAWNLNSIGDRGTVTSAKNGIWSTWHGAERGAFRVTAKPIQVPIIPSIEIESRPKPAVYGQHFNISGEVSNPLRGFNARAVLAIVGKSQITPFKSWEWFFGGGSMVESLSLWHTDELPASQDFGLVAGLFNQDIGRLVAWDFHFVSVVSVSNETNPLPSPELIDIQKRLIDFVAGTDMVVGAAPGVTKSGKLTSTWGSMKK